MSLINKIRSAQISAGEDAVCKHLEEMGLVTTPKDQLFEEWWNHFCAESLGKRLTMYERIIAEYAFEAGRKAK